MSNNKLFSFNGNNPDPAPVQPVDPNTPPTGKNAGLSEEDFFSIEEPLKFEPKQYADRITSKDIATEISALMNSIFYDYVGAKVTWDPGYMLSDGVGSLRCQLLFRYTTKPDNDDRVAGCESTFDSVKNATATRDQAIILANRRGQINDFSCNLTDAAKNVLCKYVPDRVWYTSPNGTGSGWIAIKERNRDGKLRKVHWENLTTSRRNQSWDARTGRRYEFQELIIEIDVNKLITTMYNGTKDMPENKKMAKYIYKLICYGMHSNQNGVIDNYHLLVIKIDSKEEKNYAIQQGYGTVYTDDSGWI